MPTPEHAEVARLLLEKAAQDLSAAETLVAAAGQADEIIGFHAQQAVEKALKASLAARAVEIPHTHDIGYLLELIAEHGDALPDAVGSAAWLSPWGVSFRYDALAERLDRDAALLAARSAVAWSREAIASAD